ncbi:MAG: sigma-70 family RNA polymerase sigma factor [Chloroflexi bacterium]|nr:sigma-70 family RNA polymerase sigma factor [Chloroflexota bacterium]
MDGGPQEGYDPLQRWAYYLPLALSRVLRRPPLRQRTRPREEALTPSDDEEADFDALAGPCDDPAHAALQAETAAWVQAALRRLPPDEQEALWLRDALGYPVGEAARRLGVEPAALDRCLRSARRRLWQALAALEGG